MANVDVMTAKVDVQVTDVVFDKYRKEVVDKLCSPDEIIKSTITINADYPRLLHAALGCVTEAGELADQMKKAVVYGRDLDKVNFVEELGDLLWYITLACNVLDISLAEVMMINTKKLQKRYPHQFDKALEVNRDLEGERKILDSESLKALGEGVDAVAPEGSGRFA